MNLVTLIHRRSACLSLVGCGLAGLTILSGCDPASTANVRSAKPVPVKVVDARAMDLPIEVRTIGTTRALQEVTVRARVSGFLKEVHFQEGQDIADGQLLFVFDEAPFQAFYDAAVAKVAEAQASFEAARDSKRVEIAQAQFDVARANLENARLDEQRGRRLLERNAQTREEYDKQAAAYQAAAAEGKSREADLLQARVDFSSNQALARANLDKASADAAQAKLDLDYCRLYATVDGRKDGTPIRGRAGELKLKIGNYIDPLSQAELVSIQLLDPMGVDIQPSSRYLPEVTALAKTGLKVRLAVQGDRPYKEVGKVEFVDNRVNPSTSTFLLRASVPNPQQVLLPGDYVKVFVDIGSHAAKVAVPEEAVIETQAGPVVYLVGKDGKVAIRPVEPIDLYRGLRVLDSGVSPGEKVIVEGLQLVRPGQLVQAVAQGYEPRDPTDSPLDQSIQKRVSNAERLASPNGASARPPGPDAPPSPAGASNSQSDAAPGPAAPEASPAAPTPKAEAAPPAP